MARTQDPRKTEAALRAATELLSEQSFADLSMDAIARRAGIGKPALYRRFRDKEGLVAAAIGNLLTPLEPAVEPPGTDVKAWMRAIVEQLQPADPPGYAGMIGGLMAEHRRHPRLIEEFRRQVLAPRRARVVAAVEQGQRAGALRVDLDAEVAVEMLGGAFLARVFAGLPTDAQWRDRLFEHWWRMAGGSATAPAAADSGRR